MSQLLYQGQAAASAAAVYTAGQRVRITQLRAVNNDSSARTLKLWHGGTDDTNVILPAVSIDAGGVLEGGGIVLEQGQALYAQASAASQVTLTVYGEVVMEGIPPGPSKMGFTMYDNSGQIKSVGSVANVASIGDVTITSVADNELLAYDSSGSGWINQTATEAGLAPATLDTPAAGEVLVYDTSDFINQTLDEAGIIAWLGKDTSDVSNPPTDAELDSAFGEPGTVGDAMGILDDNNAGTNIYLCVSDGTNWFTVTLAQAA